MPPTAHTAPSAHAVTATEGAAIVNTALLVSRIDEKPLARLVIRTRACVAGRFGTVMARAPLGILLALCENRLNVTEEIGRMIRGHYGRLVLKTNIRVNVRLEEAPSFGRTIFDYDAGSAGAEGYRELAKQVLHRTGRAWHNDGVIE